MKTLLGLLALLSLSFFFSCEKCGTCSETVITQDHITGSIQSTHASYEACGSELKDIDGTSETVHNTVNGQVTVSVTTTINCND